MKPILIANTAAAHLLAFLLFALTFASFALADVHPYAEFQNTITPRTIEILRRHGMPVAPDREDAWLATSSIPGNYTIWLHRSDEIPQQAVLDIVKLCMDLYQQRGRKETFRLVIYRESKEQWRKSLFLGIGYFAGVNPFFELTLQRERT